MASQDKTRNSPRGFRWSLLSFSYGPRGVDDVKAELRKLDEYEPPTEMEQGAHIKLIEQKELARLALIDELRAAEYLRRKPWLVHAPLIFWSVTLITAILIWVLVRLRG